MDIDQAFELILEHYNVQFKNEKSKPYKLNERFTGNEFNYKRVYTREGDDWHWLTITNKGEGKFMATFTDENGKITDWHFYSVKGNELILSDKERVEKDGRLSFKHQPESVKFIFDNRLEVLQISHLPTLHIVVTASPAG